MPSLIHKSRTYGNYAVARQQARPILVGHKGQVAASNMAWAYGHSNIVQSWANGASLPLQIIDTGNTGAPIAYTTSSDFGKVLFTRSGLFDFYVSIYIGAGSISGVANMSVQLYNNSAPTTAIDAVVQTFYSEANAIITPSVQGPMYVDHVNQFVRTMLFIGATTSFFVDLCRIRWIGR